MSKPTDDELLKLRNIAAQHDDEWFHTSFDDFLEAKLDKLDPEWMKVMREAYDKGGMARWCA